MKKIILASVLGALTMFLWGAISWIALPWHTSTMHSLSNEDAVAQLIKSSNPPNGTYMIPGFANDKVARDAKAKQGPIVHMYYQNEGQDPMSAMFFIKGIALDVLVLLLAVSMLSKISWSLATYSNRVKFMTMIGLIVGLSARLGDSLYLGIPLEFSGPMVIDEVISWTLAGLVVSAFMKPASLKGV